MNTLIALLRKLGLVIAWVVFLGFYIDTTDMSMRIPQDKVSKLLSLLQNFTMRHREHRCDYFNRFLGSSPVKLDEKLTNLGKKNIQS